MRKLQPSGKFRRSGIDSSGETRKVNSDRRPVVKAGRCRCLGPQVLHYPSALLGAGVVATRSYTPDSEGADRLALAIGGQRGGNSMNPNR